MPNARTDLLDGQPTPAFVRFDRLLVLYAIVPIAIGVTALDLALLSGRLRALLPAHPDRLWLFTVVFNFPHIVASHLILLDREYVGAYWRRIVGAVVVLVPITYALVLVSEDAIFTAALAFTYFHIIAQQLGLTAAQLRTRDWALPTWKVLIQLIGGCALFAIVGPALKVSVLAPAFTTIALVLVAPATLVAARLSRLAPSIGARRYLWANQALFAAMAAMLLLGYPFFTALLARVVHDLTAFYVYGVHDANRNREVKHNWLYRALAPTRLPTWALGPAIAVGAAFVVEHYLPHRLGIHVVYWLSALHYYLEGVVWKTGSPHRRSAAFG